MASDHCAREAETIRAAWQGGTAGALSYTSMDPQRAAMDPQLAAHIAECATCGEIVELARVFRDERDAACADARPPSAGAVWWRAERRAREEAARKATSPISFVHGIALGCAAAAVVALLSLGFEGARDYLVQWWNALAWPAAPTAGVGAVGLLSSLPVSALLVLAASVLLAPVVIYLALEKM